MKINMNIELSPREMEEIIAKALGVEHQQMHFCASYNEYINAYDVSLRVDINNIEKVRELQALFDDN